MEAIGKYRLIRKLAEGGMAEVFLAQVEGPGGFLKPVVVKRVLPELSKDQAFLSMFMSEAKLVAQLNHPNIVQVFDFGIHHGSYFLVMEYIDGPNLRGLYKRVLAANEGLPFDQAARMVAGACEGLAYAHAFCENGQPLNLIHRDISPENLLVGRNGVVKVADFGIAKVAGQARMTRTGTVRGKLVYMAPEQMQGEPVDCRVDVFALGIVLYELICGRRPFEAKTEVDAIRAILTGTMIPAANWRPDMPPELQQIIDKAMARSTADRFKDCIELQLALERFIALRGAVANSQSIGKLVDKYVEKVDPAPNATVILPPRQQDVTMEVARAAPPPRPEASKPALKKWIAPAAAIAVALAVVAAFAWPKAQVTVPAPVAEKVVEQPPRPVVPPVVVAAEPARPAAEEYPEAPPPPARPKQARAKQPVKKSASKLGAAEEDAEPKQHAGLKGRLKARGEAMVLFNDSTYAWTGCEVRMPFKKLFRFGANQRLAAIESSTFPSSGLSDDPRPPDAHMKEGWALARCREGSGYIWWDKD